MKTLLRRMLGVVCAGLLACSAKPAATPKQPELPASAEARWVEVEPASAVGWLEAPARALASPEASFAVSVPMSARVLRVHVRPGQRVTRGAPLVDVVLPELIKAAGALAAASLRVRGYETRETRLAQLVEQGLSRAGELNDVQVNLALAEAERAAARATLRVALISESQAEKLVNDGGSFTLRAPGDALVVRVSTRPGEVREPAGGALIELAGEGPVQIEARFAQVPPPGARLVWLAQGRALPLVRDATSPLAAPEDGSRLVWLHAEDAARSPVPGSLGRVRVQPPAAWHVVPIGALRPRDGGHVILVRRAAGEREVSVGVVLSSNSEAIVDGLAPGDQVALAARQPERAPLADLPP